MRKVLEALKAVMSTFDAISPEAFFADYEMANAQEQQEVFDLCARVHGIVCGLGKKLDGLLSGDLSLDDIRQDIANSREDFDRMQELLASLKLRAD